MNALEAICKPETVCPFPTTGTVAFSSEIAILLDFTAEHAENAEG